jgi:competence protein ComEA
VNLNTATESDLDALPGVGPTTARAIVAWRAEHGRFTRIDQLGEVTGLGPARVARLRPMVTL